MFEDEIRELEMGRMLGIRTTGRDESHASVDNNPYEPTPYKVLDRLANSGYLRKGNLLVDYGCGKGRVGLYLSYMTRCNSLGIECDEWLYAAASRNLSTAASGRRCAFELADARTYVPPPAADRFFFFNPFSAEVFAQALAGIERSLAAQPRKALLILYYPDASFVERLDAISWASLAERIDCADLFDGHDPRECMLVYRLQR